MATYAQIARAHLGSLGKVSLGFYPTPFHKLESISSAYGVNLWIKREDFSGSTLFGGNKIRKLEYLLHDAKKTGLRHRLHLWRYAIQSRDGNGYRRSALRYAPCRLLRGYRGTSAQ